MNDTNMEKLLAEHTKREDERFNQLVDDISTIKNNHLHHMEKDIAGIHIKLATMDANMGWVKWGIVLVLAGLVSGAIALIFKN